MKTYLNILLVLLVGAPFIGCSDDDDQKDEVIGACIGYIRDADGKQLEDFCQNPITQADCSCADCDTDFEVDKTCEELGYTKQCFGPKYAKVKPDVSCDNPDGSVSYSSIEPDGGGTGSHEADDAGVADAG